MHVYATEDESTQPIWIDVKQVLPDPFVAVLAYIELCSSMSIVIACYNPSTNEWLSATYETKYKVKVTHWMPLPEPPQ